MAKKIYALGGVKSHVKEAAYEIGEKFDVATIYGVGGRTNPTSDHPKGLALDFMVYGDRAKGDAIAEYAVANAGRLGITYVIWWQRIYTTSGSDAHKWRQMEDRGSITQNHKDHPHISFSDNAPSALATGAAVVGAIGSVAAEELNPINQFMETFRPLVVSMNWLRQPGNGLRLAAIGFGMVLILAALITWDNVKTVAQSGVKTITNIAKEAA